MTRKQVSTEELIQRIKAKSKNGIAPPANKVVNEYVALTFRLGKTWEEVCNYAGLKTSRQIAAEEKERKKYKTQQNRELAKKIEKRRGELHKSMMGVDRFYKLL